MKYNILIFLLRVFFVTISALETDAQSGTKHTIQSAGIEFQIPNGWQLTETKDGDVVLFAEKGSVLITFMFGEQAQLERTAAGLRKGLEMKLSDFVATKSMLSQPFNEIPTTFSKGTGSLSKATFSWGITLFKTKKPFIIYVFGLERSMKKIQDNREYFVFENSLKINK
jgi:hypothetical protein